MIREEIVIISACLLGVNCRYDGGNCLSERIVSQSTNTMFIPVCPEQLGGLSTPRVEAFFTGGSGKDVLIGKAKVVNINGKDVSSHFIRGAEEVLKICKLYGCSKAVLKSKSPSCGFGRVYIDSTLADGNGVTTALLLENNLHIIER